MAYAAYENDTDRDHNVLKGFLRDLEFPEAPVRDVTDLPIYFLGVWDTVGALGLSGRAQYFTAPYTEFHHTELPGNVTHARHALALHELRSRFAPLLWKGTSREGQTLRQVWFAGAHADVGGGYRRRDEHNTRSDIALDWMAREAAANRLRLADLPRPEGSQTSQIHNSISGLFEFATPAIRRPVGLPETLSPATVSTFAVHGSALNRLLPPANGRYEFRRMQVNETLEMVDRLTVRLRVSLAEHDGPVAQDRIAAASEWWKDLSWPTADARGDVWELATSDPPQSAPTPFERALLFQIVGSDGKVPETLESGFRLATSTKPEREEDALALLARIENVLLGIDAVIRVLPDRFVSALREFRSAATADLSRLTPHADRPAVMNTIRYKTQKTPGLRDTEKSATESRDSEETPR